MLPNLRAFTLYPLLLLSTSLAGGCLNWSADVDEKTEDTDNTGADGGIEEPPIACAADETCREAVSECDLAETCGGADFCPEDVHVEDGTPCSLGSCLQGRCLPVAGLIGYWPFDDDTSTEASPDFTSITGDANLSGAIFGEGKLGTALHFDGLDDSVAIPTILYPEAFALTFWFQIEATQEPRVLFSHGSAGSSRITVSYSGGRGAVFLADEGGTEVNTNLGAEVADGSWHHLAIARSTSGRTEVYLDGGLRAREELLPIRPTGDVLIGRNTGGTIFSKMRIDDLRVYSREFPITEAQSLVREAGDSTPIVAFPLADTYVESHLPDTPQDQSTKVTVKETYDPGGIIDEFSRYRNAFLRFDVAGIPAGNPVFLRLYTVDRGSLNTLSIRVSALSDDSWEEASVTYSSQPSLASVGEPKDAVTSDVGVYTELDISEFVSAAGSDGMLSLRIEAANYINGDSYASFSSREGRYPPQLRTAISID